MIACYPKGTVFGFGHSKPLAELGLVHNIFASSVGDYPSLVGLITGPAAEAFGLLDEESRKAAVLSQYASMYSLEVEPVAFLIRDWTKSERYSGGCFAGIFPPTSDAVFATHFECIKRAF